jgi:type II secretory pathway pseudopilin PulG
MPRNPLGAESDDGFTIVEVVMAGLLAVIVVVGLAGSMSVALREARYNRFQQTATAVALDEMEAVRALEWAQLAMSSVDGGAPLLTAAGTAVDGAAAGLPRDEPLMVAESGAVEPFTLRTVEGVTYTVWRYVTLLDYQSRRFVLEVVWDIGEVTSHHLTATVITRATAEQTVIGDE